MTVISVTAISIIIGYISSFALNIKSADLRCHAIGSWRGLGCAMFFVVHKSDQ